jgi:hypothetical protein
MSWHHIIPRSLLRDVWNSLVDRHIATELAEARLAIRGYLLLSNRNLANADFLIDRIRAENTSQRRAGHHHLQPLTVAEAHQLGTAAVWPAWNAVEGPQRRSDDPQDRYFDRFTAGLTAPEAARMRAIEVLFGHLQTFANARPCPGPAGSPRSRSSGIDCPICCRLRPAHPVSPRNVGRRRRPLAQAPRPGTQHRLA